MASREQEARINDRMRTKLQTLLAGYLETEGHAYAKHLPLHPTVDEIDEYMEELIGACANGPSAGDAAQKKARNFGHMLLTQHREQVDDLRRAKGLPPKNRPGELSELDDAQSSQDTPEAKSTPVVRERVFGNQMPPAFPVFTLPPASASALLSAFETPPAKTAKRKQDA